MQNIRQKNKYEIGFIQKTLSTWQKVILLEENPRSNEEDASNVAKAFTEYQNESYTLVDRFVIHIEVAAFGDTLRGQLNLELYFSNPM